MTRRLLTVFFLLCILMNLLAFSVSAETSGDCGDNATWSLDDSGVLTISGTGAMKDYIYSGYDPSFSKRAPWRKNSSAVKQIVIEPGITSIGDNAFCCLPNLTTVSIPDTVTSIGESAFCRNDILNNVTIPDSVTVIEKGAFNECKKLSKISLPSYLEKLGGYCFEMCVSLTSITIPEGITVLGSRTFFASGLTSIQLPESLEVIHASTFDATELKSITIPRNVTHIYTDAFSYCVKLKSVYFVGNAPYIDSRAFDACTLTAYYPKDDSSWTEEVRQDYGGTITWVAYCGSEHTWGQWKTEREATCAKTGLKKRSCTQCDMTQEEKIPKTDHQYDSVVTPPTCKDEGFTTHTCIVCNDTYTDSKTPVGPHTYQDEVTAPSCTQAGFTTHICTVCGHTVVDTYTEVTEHTFGQWNIVIAATCLEKGSRQRSCTVCQAQETEETDLAGHTYHDEVTAPSCTQEGFTTHICTVCEYIFVDTYTEMIAHTYGEWIESKPASWKEAGEQYRQCTGCTEQQTQALPKLPFNWELVVGIIAVLAAAVVVFVVYKKKHRVNQ